MATSQGGVRPGSEHLDSGMRRSLAHAVVDALPDAAVVGELQSGQMLLGAANATARRAFFGNAGDYLFLDSSVRSLFRAGGHVLFHAALSVVRGRADAGAAGAGASCVW